MGDSGQLQFLLDHNTLIVRGELGPEDEAAYAEQLFRLLNCGSTQLVLDLTGLHYMSSAYVGAACLLAFVAKEQKRSLIILANREIGRLLLVAGLDKLTEVRIAKG